ncbi:ABC transporter permease [candidate division KSB1 bacterium]|nr:ABC transporter permease [candidate division KSB1 bacterium]
MLLKASLAFLAVALFCFIFADIEITTLDPWFEFQRMITGALTPDFSVLIEFRSALLNTVTFALCGIFIAVIFGTVLALMFHLIVVRLFCAFIRAIHEIFWVFILLPVVGLNPICGVLAIAIPYSGIFAKVYAEILQEADQRPLKGLPPKSNPISKFVYGVLPVIYADIKNYTAYRFECALRSSTVLGFIGLPTLGFYLETAFREGNYSEAAAMLFSFYLLIASLKYWLKPRLVPVYVGAAFVLISKEVSLSWANVSRFTYEILPWPMRREGFLSGTNEIVFPFEEVRAWVINIFQNEALDGIWQTAVLTQIVLVATGLFALVGFTTISRTFFGAFFRRISHFALIVIRTTPEYILAYVFLQLWGPSMLPAIFAIALHNSAILAYLSGQNTNLIELRLDAPRKKMNRYFFEVLPRIYGQFLAFLFYRWEVMMRESAILGILGIYTLGFFIDSAISDDKLDKAVLLIVITALLNMLIDTISHIVRRRLKVSTKLVTSY